MPGKISKGALKLLLALLLCQLPAVLRAQWTQSVLFNDSDMALDLSDALTFQKYPTYEQYLQMMQGFASDHPDICRLDTFGYSQEGRLLLALEISDHVQRDEPEAAFLYSSTMHGDEVLGFVLLLRLADTLLSGYGTDSEITTLVDELQIWINPLANPDGSYSADQGLSLQHAVRTTMDGSDLNRDFPDIRTGEADDTTGRALENRYMMEFLAEHRFSLSANLHGGEEVVNYPWDYTYDLHADDDWYRFISHEYAEEAMAVDPSYMFGWPDGGITNGAVWYRAYGTRQDYMNYYLGGREVTLELSRIKLLPSDELEDHWKINYRSLINYMGQCMYGIRGKVSDLDSGDPLHARMEVLNHDSSYSMVYSRKDQGDFYRLIKEGIYDLVSSAPGYRNDTLTGVVVTDYSSTLLDIRLEAYGLAIADREAPGFRIWPNPATYNFYVETLHMPPGEITVTVHSLTGTLVYKNTLPFYGEGIAIPTSTMEPGIYLVRCTLGNLSEVQRVVVRKSTLF